MESLRNLSDPKSYQRQHGLFVTFGQSREFEVFSRILLIDFNHYNRPPEKIPIFQETHFVE